MDIKEFSKEIIKECLGSIDSDTYEVIKRHLGVGFIINAKRDLGYDLEDEEIDYLVEMMNSQPKETTIEEVA